jgi:predicted RecA/RadA family phage recombinase
MPEPRATLNDKDVRGPANATGLSIARRLFVALDPASTAQPPSVKLPSDGGDAYGVTMDAIPDGSRGNVQRDGAAVVTSAAAVAIGDRVSASAAGKAQTAAAGHVVHGHAVTAASGADQDIEVELSLNGLIQP